MVLMLRLPCGNTKPFFVLLVSLRNTTASSQSIHASQSEIDPSDIKDSKDTRHNVPADSCIFSTTLKKVMTAIVENKDLGDGFQSIRGIHSWSVDLVAEALRSIPRIYFHSERSIGCQSGFRRRAPLKQRYLREEERDSSERPQIRARFAYRDPQRVELGVNRGLEFFHWVETEGEFSHTEMTCREMALILAKSNSLKKLWGFLHEMSRKRGPGGLVTTATVTAVIKVLGEEGLVKEALMAFYRMKQLWCKPDVIAYNTMIAALCRIGDFKKARFLFDQMEIPGSRCPPDVITYTVLISAYCKHSMRTACRKAIRRRLWEANHLFRSMVFKGFKPDVITYNCLIDGLCKNYRIERALDLLNTMSSSGCSPNRVTYNSFIRYYSAVNEIEKAVEMMVLMTSQNHGITTSSSYTPIIHALCESGRICEARDYLIKMVRDGCIPRVYTYKLVTDALHAAGESCLPDEVCQRIEYGIDIRYKAVENIKPIMRNKIEFERHTKI